MDKIEKFINIFKENKQNLGEFKLIEEKKEIYYDIEKKLSIELRDFYLKYKLEDSPTICGDFYIEFIPLKRIKDIEEGWKWIKKDGKLVRDISWNENWVIFAVRKEDILIADMGEEGTPIIGSIQKRNFKIADSFIEFFDVLTECIIIEEKTFNGDTRNEDLSFKLEFLEAVKCNLENKLSKGNAMNFYNFFFE
jgi:hypothetical protein